MVVGLRPAMGSISTTATPPSTAATAQFTIPSRSGLSPASSAPLSLSAAARVARPKRVKRYTPHNTAATATARPARSRRLALTVEPNTSTGFSGSKATRSAVAALDGGTPRRTTSWR